VLFREGTAPDGVYLLHSGEVDLSFSAKPLLDAGPGEILGLTAVMSNRTHDSTATTRTECVTGFIETHRFLRLLDEQPSLWLAVLQRISANISACWDCMRALGTGQGANHRTAARR
jgi:CRP-like cAMP-binding protein